MNAPINYEIINFVSKNCNTCISPKKNAVHLKNSQNI